MLIIIMITIIYSRLVMMSTINIITVFFHRPKLEAQAESHYFRKDQLQKTGQELDRDGAG